MRVPLNWVAGYLLLLAASVVVGGLYLFLGYARWARRRRWASELQRRRGLATRGARIEECLKITDTDVRLVLSIEASSAAEDTPAQLRLRGIARLPADVLERLDVDGVIPVRLDRDRPSRSTIDLPALAGRDTAAEERDAYLARGSDRWEIVG